MKVTIVKGFTCLLIMLAVISTTVIMVTDSKIKQNENLSKKRTVTTQLTTEVTTIKKVQETTEEMTEVTTEQITEKPTEATTVEPTTTVKLTTVGSIETTEPEEPEETEAQIENSETYTAVYSATEFMNMGVIYWNDWRWTWYSERVLPGGGLNIPGRYADSSGYICDENDYICLSASSLDKGTIISTPFGKSGKVYDTGCATDTIDVYVNW